MSELLELSLDESWDDEHLWDDDMCKRCGCCDNEWEECYQCGGEGGRGGEDLMMEDPLWYDEDDFIKCDICEGNGGWTVCSGGCDEHGKHQSNIDQVEIFRTDGNEHGKHENIEK